MKKAALFLFAALLVLMFTVPAMAMEHQFGGYWRTRFYTNQNFDGNDAEPPSGDESVVDTRTRLYYTAIFNENLKFRNEFEFDGTWGSARGSRLGQFSTYTDFGADGANVEIKKSYVDFTLGPINAKVGVQGACLARGFLFCAPDFPGATITYVGDNFSIPFIWMRPHEGGISDNSMDVDYFGLMPKFNLNNITINPYVYYAYSNNATDYPAINPFEAAARGPNSFESVDIFWVGMDLDMNFDPVSIWFTGIYEGGNADYLFRNDDVDFQAWLAALGFSVDFGMGDVHGQVFYATGDDDPTDDKWESFMGFGESGASQNFNQSYYWSEIMGMGIIDWATTTNSPGDAIHDILAAGLGATVKPVDKLAVSLDVWYAQLAEDTLTLRGDETKDLGVEVDLTITYKLIDGLNLDLVGAYLFAGDATTLDHPDAADPYEIGSRLSLSF